MLKRKHWIITRFNVGVYMRPTDQIVTWMAKRLYLFASYTAKSLHQQTIKNFAWLLLVDEHTNRKYLKHIRSICDGLEYYIVPVTGFKCKRYGERASVGGRLAETIRNFIGDRSKISIQTRLDSDDFYNPHAVKTIQTMLKNCHSRNILDFKYGYIYDSRDNSLYTAEHGPGSPWITGMFYNSTGKTIYDQIHSKYRQNLIYSQIGRMWIMVLHDMNVSNKLIKKMKPRKINKTVIRGWAFGIE